jgi:hypothetical protein
MGKGTNKTNTSTAVADLKAAAVDRPLQHPPAPQPEALEETGNDARRADVIAVEQEPDHLPDHFPGLLGTAILATAHLPVATAALMSRRLVQSPALRRSDEVEAARLGPLGQPLASRRLEEVDAQEIARAAAIYVSLKRAAPEAQEIARAAIILVIMKHAAPG